MISLGHVEQIREETKYDKEWRVKGKVSPLRAAEKQHESERIKS